jgi:hypothetical protein
LTINDALRWEVEGKLDQREREREREREHIRGKRKKTSVT